MWQEWQYYFNSILLGVGLAMDACAVSMANGLNEPKMRVGKISLVAAMFGVFQAAMPMIGWVCVHFIAEQFAVFNKIVPFIALALLGYIGGKMLFEGFRHGGKEKPTKKAVADVAETATDAATDTAQSTATDAAQDADATDGKTATDASNEAPVVVATEIPAAERKPLTFWVLITQAVATSIDALSVGFTISNYNVWEALVAACIIAVVTFGISFGAVFIGKKFGTKLGNKAEILGGFILIAIGLEIFIQGMIEHFA